MNKIVLRNVSKTIKGRSILNQINLKLDRGKAYGFLGRNGSGKTMLLKAIAGLIVPTNGSIEVFGEKISDDNIFPKDMGLIIEDIGLWSGLTGFENLKLISGINKIIGDEGIKNALIRVGLNPNDKRKYKAYSLGMKKKLVIAQAIMEHPKLLILDEPTNGLDKESVSLFKQIIIEEKNSGTTCLIATHLLSDIEELCDGLYELDDGYCSVYRKDIQL